MAWALVIFAARETLVTLLKTIHAATDAAQGRASIDVLVNGNPQLAASITRHFEAVHDPATTEVAGATRQNLRIRIWSIPVGDKANAWNQYIHQIWSGETIAFFIDGYVRLNADAIQLLGTAVDADERALGGSGVPTVGRSADAIRQSLIVNSGFHGNFCCIKGTVLSRMCQSSIFLPVGLYRVDALMGALLCYALDPAIQLWEDYFIVINPSASWRIDAGRWWHPGDLTAYFKRFLRQAKGQLENRAFADHLAIRRQLPQKLPGTAQELVLEWAERCPTELQAAFMRQPLCWVAFNDIRNAKPQSAGDMAPTMVWQS